MARRAGFFILAHERELAHSDERAGYECGVLVADFVCVVAFVEQLANVHEAGEQGNERGGSFVLGDGRPVIRRQLHGLVTVLRRSLESLRLVQGDRRDDEA